MFDEVYSISHVSGGGGERKRKHEVRDGTYRGVQNPKSNSAGVEAE